MSYADGPNSQNEMEIQTEVTLVEAYPISVNDIGMSWGDDGYAKLQVEIKYRYSIENNRKWNSAAASLREKSAKSVTNFFKDNPGAGNI
jgi:hypothetical protein